MNNRKTFRIEVTDDHIQETRNWQTENSCIECAIARALNQNGYYDISVEPYEIIVGDITYSCLDNLHTWQTNFMIKYDADPILIEFEEHYDDNDKVYQFVGIC